MLGFMLVTMFLSMWISNTATTAMMTPIIEQVVNILMEDPASAGDPETGRRVVSAALNVGRDDDDDDDWGSTSILPANCLVAP